MSPRPGELARVEVSIRGRVHGVGYRYFVIDAAMSIGLAGWVANEQDGSVHVVAEGPRGDLERLIGLLGEGPVMAEVEDVVTVWMPYTGRWTSFGIRSSGHSGD